MNLGGLPILHTHNAVGVMAPWPVFSTEWMNRIR